VLLGLGLITEFGAENDSQERVLMYDVWRTLRGEDQQVVDLEDLQVFLLVVLHMPDHRRIGKAPEEGEEVGFHGFWNGQGKFCVKAEDVGRIQRHFDTFYVNRLQFLGKQKRAV